MQSCLDLENPAITKRAHLRLVSSVCQPLCGCNLIRFASPPSLQKVSESEASVGIQLIQTPPFTLHRMHVVFIWQPVSVCLQPAERLEACPDRLLADWSCSTWGGYTVLLIHPQTRTKSSGRGITSVYFPIIWITDSRMMQTISSSSWKPLCAALYWKEFNHFNCLMVFSETRLLLFADDLLKLFESRIEKLKKEDLETDSHTELLWLIEKQNDNMLTWWVRADYPFGANHCWILY